jgi:hypothetical protein
MTKMKFALNALGVATIIFAAVSLSQAQATRTWVSGVGDDANPCSRTAPCKTFAGAISKTFIGGEIDALDPGGFGAVTITKSITIDGCCITSILASGTNGINVAIAAGNANDPQRRVVIRHITINGTGANGTVGTATGLKGVNITAANSVSIENCFIQNFTQQGVSASFAEDGAYLTIKDTNIINCNSGVLLATTVGKAFALLERTRVEKMAGNGILFGGGGNGILRDSVFTKNGGDGVSIAAGNTNGTISCDAVMTAFNNVGVRAGGAGSVLIISNTSIMNNTLGPATGGGTFITHGNNQISGNGTIGTTPTPNIGQQ